MRRLAALSLVLVLPLLACGAGGGDDDATAASPADPSLLFSYDEGLPSSAGTRSSGSAAAAAPEAAVGGSSGSASSTSGSAVPPATAALRAGSGRVDNARFTEFLASLKRSTVQAEPLDVSERHIVTVVDKDGKKVLGAQVALRAGGRDLQTARTHADGRALLFPGVTAEQAPGRTRSWSATATPTSRCRWPTGRPGSTP